MKKVIPENLCRLAEFFPFPLYLVGGSVRDHLAGLSLPQNADWDICAPAAEEDLLTAAQRAGFRVRAVYRNTGTVKLQDNEGADYEFTRFRSDKYVRGAHTPSEIIFTDDMQKDAVRRDFCANAVYYDIRAEQFFDPLGGISDIQKKLLRTVAPARKVFGEDGLRLMRLARQSAETGFTPDGECLAGAREHAALIQDIAPERIYAELVRLLRSDGKRGDGSAPYRGLCILRETGVLKHVLPELALGENMRQREDFHRYDVLEHSFRCVRYAPPEIRFAALLHDAGKPYCYLRDGNFYEHAKEGARSAEKILTGRKAPKKLIVETKTLVSLHMKDYNLQMRPNKIRRTIVEYFPYIEALLALFQADFSACKDDTSPAPAAVKWRNVLNGMKAERAPRCMKELNANGDDLLKIGIRSTKLSSVLKELLDYAALDGTRNRREILTEYARKHYL